MTKNVAPSRDLARVAGDGYGGNHAGPGHFIDADAPNPPLGHGGCRLGPAIRPAGTVMGRPTHQTDRSLGTNR
jgi:hypothetical protein